MMIVSQYGNQLYSKEKKKKKKTLCSVDMIMPPKGHNQYSNIFCNLFASSD